MSGPNTEAVPTEDDFLGASQLTTETVRDTVRSVSRSQRSATEQLHAMDDYEAQHADEPMQRR